MKNRFFWEAGTKPQASTESNDERFPGWSRILFESIGWWIIIVAVFAGIYGIIEITAALETAKVLGESLFVILVAIALSCAIIYIYIYKTRPSDSNSRSPTDEKEEP